MKFVVDDKIPFIKGVLERTGADVLYSPGAKIAKEDLMDADGLIVRTRTICDEKLLKGTKVKFIATATIGFDHIDRKFCENNGIYWTNAPGCNSSSVAQYICSVLLNWACEFRKDLSECCLGIVGVGHVGSKVERLGNIFGMKVLLNDPPRERREGGEKFVSLQKILEEADIITLHVPLEYEGIDKTYHLADEEFFCEIRKKVFFINSARGEVVKSEALKKALKGEKLAGAALDVWENEPHIDRELLSLAKFATPHIAGYSTDGKANGTAMTVRAVSRFFGLGLDEWFPENIPIPECTEVELTEVDSWEVVRQAVNFSYDVRIDTRMLKRAPGDFEKLRGEYWLRREFPVFTVKTNGISNRWVNILKALEFKIK